MLRVAVCEDDPISREILLAMIRKYWKQKSKEQEALQISSYTDGKNYKEHWNIGKEVDILLLDIEMEIMDGILLKEFLEHQNSKTKILFITEHMEVMQEAFGANVYGFLLKPVEEKKLFFYLDKIFRHIFYEMEEVLIDREGKYSYKICEIFWIKADGRYSKVRLKKNEIFSDRSLTTWEEELERFSFFRIHKSYLVNFKQVSQIGDEVVFSNGDRLLVARRKRKNLKEAYKKFLIQSAIGG